MSNLTDDLKTVKSYLENDHTRLFESYVLIICIESVEDLEKENAKLKRTLKNLRENYTIAGEDAYNLIKEALNEY